MRRVAQALFDGLRLRCPRCRRGQMLTSMFAMRGTCPVCGMPFERSSGEITGGMGINSVVTLFLVVCCGVFVGVSPSLPLVPSVIILLLIAVIFPIAFYPVSRGLWASILYLTGDNDEPD